MNHFEQLEKLKLSAPPGLSAFGSVAPPQLNTLHSLHQNP